MMVLEIKHSNNEFYIRGALNRKSLPLFENTFLNIFEENDQVVINIENLSGIDREGVNALARLHNESVRQQKKLSIVGLGCKELYQHFNDNDAA